MATGAGQGLASVHWGIIERSKSNPNHRSQCPADETNHNRNCINSFFLLLLSILSACLTNLSCLLSYPPSNYHISCLFVRLFFSSFLLQSLSLSVASNCLSNPPSLFSPGLNSHTPWCLTLTFYLLLILSNLPFVIAANRSDAVVNLINLHYLHRVGSRIGFCLLNLCHEQYAFGFNWISCVATERRSVRFLRPNLPAKLPHELGAHYLCTFPQSQIYNGNLVQIRPNASSQRHFHNSTIQTFLDNENSVLISFTSGDRW